MAGIVQRKVKNRRNDARSVQFQIHRPDTNINRAQNSDGRLCIRFVAAEIDMIKETVRRKLTEDLGITKMICSDSKNSWLRNSLQNVHSTLFTRINPVCNFLLVSKMKIALKRQRFPNIPGIH